MSHQAVSVPVTPEEVSKELVKAVENLEKSMSKDFETLSGLGTQVLDKLTHMELRSMYENILPHEALRHMGGALDQLQPLGDLSWLNRRYNDIISCLLRRWSANGVPQAGP